HLAARRYRIRPAAAVFAACGKIVAFVGEGRRMGEGPVISIIDDDPSVRKATDGLVRALGYRAETFASAEDFLQSGHIDDASCLITDVQMPGLSGVELQTMLNARGTRVPIIFITAFPEDRIRRCVLEAGAIGFLSKPFEESLLIEHL